MKPEVRNNETKSRKLVCSTQHLTPVTHMLAEYMGKVAESCSASRITTYGDFGRLNKPCSSPKQTPFDGT